MKELKIRVERVNGELFFAVQGVYLGFLGPHDFNFKASFTVARGDDIVEAGEVLDFGNYHQRRPGFLIRGRSSVELVVDDLEPDDFAEGDEVVFVLSERAGPQTTDIKLGFAHAIVSIAMQKKLNKIEDIEDDDEREQKMFEHEQAYLKAVAEYVIADGTILRPKKQPKQ